MQFSEIKLKKFDICAVTLFLIQGAVLLLVAPLQVDPHHDGIILGAAIASSNGLFGPSEAFSQYGPLSPLLHGWFLEAFGNSMLNLRYFAALNALVISALLFSLIRKIADHWVALLISSTWVFTSAIWSTTFPGALLPWPSLIATALLLSGMNLLTPVFSENQYSRNQIYSRLAIAGCLFGLTGFARQQTWIAAALTLILLILYYKKLTKEIYFFVSGAIVSVSMVFLWIVNLGSLNSYINQVIIWPLSAYTTLGTSNNYNRYQFASYLIQSIVFVAFLYFFGRLQSLTKNKVFPILVLVITSSLVMFNGFWISKQDSWDASLRVVFGEPQEKLIISLSYFACLCAIFLPFYFLAKTKFKVPKNLFQYLFVSCLGLVGVIQLYPQPDVLHLWWVSPLFLPSSLIALNLLAKKWKLIDSKNFTTVNSVFSILGIILAAMFILRSWSEYDVPVLKGTFSFEEKAQAVNRFSEVEKYIQPRQTSFDCPDGVYAVNNGKYNAADEWFVNWGMLNSENPDIGLVRVICNQDLAYAESEALRLGMKLERHIVSDYSNISFAVLVARTQ
jgi:hypothetical protein